MGMLAMMVFYALYTYEPSKIELCYTYKNGSYIEPFLHTSVKGVKVFDNSACKFVDPR